MGAKAVLRQAAEEAARAFTQSRGLDAILICADTPSADPVELAATIARDRARVVAVGAVGQALPRKLYYEKELSFINSRSYGPGRYDSTYEEAGQDYPIGYVRWTEGRNLEAFVELLASGRLDVKSLITHRFPIDRSPLAYELITGKNKEPFLGVLLTYPMMPVSDAPVPTALVSSSPVSHATGKRDADQLGEIRLGVLGAGNFATAVLLPVLKRISGIDLVGVASASGVSAAHARRRFGFRYATSDEAQLIDDPALDTIAILTRHHLHARQVLHALAAGKHVFCEKPLAITSDQLLAIRDQLSQLAEHPPLLMVGFNRRFAPLAVKLHAFLASRQEPLAAHYRVNAGYIAPDHWVHDPEQGGGRIIGEACHFIDFLTFLIGAPPLTVEASGLPDVGRYRDDNAILTFTFPDGSIGTVSYLANGDKAFSKERVEVFAGGRAAVLDDFRLLEMVQEGRIATARSRLRQDKGHEGEWRAFLAAIAAGGPPPIPYEHLFGVTSATFAALQALKCHERVPIARVW
jgi:predicted dehydrogenase